MKWIVANAVLLLFFTPSLLALALVPLGPKNLKHLLSPSDFPYRHSHCKWRRGMATPASATAASNTALQASLQQFAPQAVNLFNNMKTPASILAGALVPLGLLAPLPSAPTNVESAAGNTNEGFARGESRVARYLRQSYVAVAVLSLLSELISVTWATVAVNQLIETHVAPAESVWYVRRLSLRKVRFHGTQNSCEKGKKPCCLISLACFDGSSGTCSAGTLTCHGWEPTRTLWQGCSASPT
jgi:hypothetical protein